MESGWDAQEIVALAQRRTDDGEVHATQTRGKYAALGVVFRENDCGTDVSGRARTCSGFSSAKQSKDACLRLDAHADANFLVLKRQHGRTRQRLQRVANPDARFHRLDSDT